MKTNFFVNLLMQESGMNSRRAQYDSENGSTRCRVVAVSTTCRCRVWLERFSRMAAVLCLLVTLGVGNVCGATIASWGKISIAASTNYTATGGDANNNGVAKFSSNKAINTGAGTNSYYGASAGGAIITFSSLNLSTYTSIQISFYSRASASGTMYLDCSTDGVSWVSVGSATLNGTESQKTISGIPYYATYLRLSHNQSSGSLYFGTVTISGTAATMRTVTWHVNGETTTAGSPTVSVPNGAKVGVLPTAPSSSACDGTKVFMGWSATEIVGTTNTEPADLFDTFLDAPTVSANTDYYAVFATATPGADTNREYSFLTSSATSTSTSAGWSITNTTNSYADTYGATWLRNNGANLPIFSFSPSVRISKITIKVRQSNTTGSNTVACSVAGATVDSYSMSGTTQYNMDFTPTTPTKGTIVIRCTNTSANGTGQGSFYVASITLKESGTTYSAYATTCTSCSNEISWSAPTITDAASSGSTITFDKVSPVATCAGSTTIQATLTMPTGYQATALSFTGGSVSVSPTISLPVNSTTTYTLTFAQNTNATLTTTATIAAKPLNSISLSATTGEVYVGQYATFTITYDPADIVTKGTSLDGPPSYCVTTGTTNTTLKITGGKAGASITENKTETVTIKANADNTKKASVTMTIKPLPYVSFVDIVHDKTDFTGLTDGKVTATLSANALVPSKPVPTHADVSAPVGGNACETQHLHLIGWIYSEWSGVANYLSGTADAPNTSAITGATVGTAEGFPASTPCFIAVGSNINTSTWNGKTFYAVWAKEVMP